mmetsp:Transcript_24788/g.50295  ORF Transcript_24788/g.50295 Transcript_24788/m.50295 type:complete len:202 (-) Transcript_24788:415-1020(-)
MAESISGAAHSTKSVCALRFDSNRYLALSGTVACPSLKRHDSQAGLGGTTRRSVHEALVERIDTCCASSPPSVISTWSIAGCASSSGRLLSHTLNGMPSTGPAHSPPAQEIEKASSKNVNGNEAVNAGVELSVCIVTEAVTSRGDDTAGSKISNTVTPVSVFTETTRSSSPTDVPPKLTSTMDSPLSLPWAVISRSGANLT